MNVNTEWESLGLFPTGLAADIARQSLEEAGIPVLVPTIALAHARETLDWPDKE